MNRNLLLWIATTFFWLSFQSIANAADIRWSGFGSIVGGTTLNEEDLTGDKKSTFATDPTLTGKVDGTYKDSWSFRPDSNFGLQITTNLTEGLEITSLLTARGGNEFNVEAEWLYASYRFTPKFTGLIGRQRLPLYMYSDYLDVAYAYHWLRPPLDVYGEGVSAFEGVSGLYRDYIGDWDYELQGYYGAARNETAGIGDTTLENLMGFVSTISNDWFKVRASIHQAEAWVVNAPLMEEDNKQDFLFTSLAISVEKETYFVMAEVTLLEIDKYAQSSSTTVTFDRRESWMVSAGLNFDNITPYITFSGRDVMLTGDGIAPLDGLTQKAETKNIGIQWHFHPQASIKADYTSRQDNSDAPLLAGGKKQEVDVFAIGINFVF